MSFEAPIAVAFPAFSNVFFGTAEGNLPYTQEELRERVLFTGPEIQQRVQELAEEITESYRGANLLLLTVPKGGIPFSRDLAAQIQLPFGQDIIQTSSYGQHGDTSSGIVKVLQFPDQRNIRGRDVLIVDDIVDTGRNLGTIKRLLRSCSPNSINVCCFLDKYQMRDSRFPIQPEHVGFKIDNHFAVGYGLDYREYFRELDYIAVLQPHMKERIDQNEAKKKVLMAFGGVTVG